MKKWNYLYGLLAGFIMVAACFSYNEAMASREISYQVQPGDTLWAIIEPYCKNGDQVQAFVYETSKKNGGSNIHAGEQITLVIPR